MTDSECRLWVCLRSDFDGKFRRQEPLGPYICDFVCSSHRLVVEVDGSQHLDDPRDVERDRYLRRVGFRVVRVSSSDVMAHLDDVLERIASVVDDRPSIHERRCGE
jgi:very-short-patch-repair endonuclease